MNVKTGFKWFVLGTCGIGFLVFAFLVVYVWPQAKFAYRLEQTLSNHEYPSGSPFVAFKNDADLRLSVVRCLASSARHDLSLGIFMSDDETIQILQHWLTSEQGAKSLSECYNESMTNK